jgi:RluA family pseudouridine synthase
MLTQQKPLVVFQDDFFLVIDKPAGMVVNRAETTQGAETVQDWVERKLKLPRLPKEQEESKTRDTYGTFDTRDVFYSRSGIVHRLDKETSGLLLIAKTPEVFENLQRQFKERKVKKKYLALVHGRVGPNKGVIEASISRSPFDRKKFGVFLGGRPAKTRYKILRYYENKILGKFSLLELSPETGRTHQIRVHLKFIGYPVVGDEKYAGRKTAKSDRQWCPRQFLHASFLSFTHPITGQKMSFSSKLPSDLQLAMMKIRA